jgi:DNA invertase Pin-like site-specific DNA recombinase
VQRELIESWATMHGARVLDVFVELDESGGRADRRLLETALRRVESGISQGIVVSKVSRFGRSLLSGLAAIERVKAAGGRFVSVQDGLDTSTDSGRLVLHILLSLAEWEGDRIRAEWDQARASAIRRGVYTSAGSPVGYRKARSGPLRPAPEAVAAIVEVFRRTAEGESFSSLARWFEEQGIRTAHGNPGRTSISMAKLVRSPAYLGQIPDGPYVNEHAHPPLVDATRWQAAQHPKRVVLLHELQPALLARLVRCAGCSLTMSAYWHRAHGTTVEVIYRCQGHTFVATPAPAPAMAPATSAAGSAACSHAQREPHRAICKGARD